MAFLDNSGDIILDAVLTDLGREEMAAGSFSVTYFALGDDEIDYGLYNKNHPSGSAYYDLEILQTPIFEAFTQTNSSINYGLLETTATDLLYMPVLRLNTSSADTNCAVPSQTAGSKGVIWVTDSQNDTTEVKIFTQLTNSTNDFALNYLLGAAGGSKVLLIEDGLNTLDIRGTSDNVTTYLNGMVDSFFYVFYDSRFINSIYGPAAAGDATYSQNTDCTAALNMGTLASAPAATTGIVSGLENFSTTTLYSGNDSVYYVPDSKCNDTDVSTILGPRGSMVVLNVQINPNLGTEYALYGTTNSTTALPNNRAVDYIDTILYVQGVTTGAMIQIPLRIVRLAA